MTTNNDLMDIIRKFSQRFNKPMRYCLKLVEDKMPIRASDTRGRASSSNNAIAKDWARISAPPWLTDDETFKRNIFRGILFSGKCDYCGCHLKKSDRERDHFIPSSARRDSLYGADHDGNKFNVCRSCNQFKQSFHPTIIIEKMRREHDYRRANAFQRFLEIFERKLTLRQDVVRKIQYYQRLMDERTKYFCDQMEKDMMNLRTIDDV